MTKKYSTKKALIASVLALCMCFTMLVGTTFAWFTDSASSTGNIIQTGKLNVEMYWAEGDLDPEVDSNWEKVNGPIFKNDKWEPGYAEAKHIKIANEGTLALKYQMRILVNGVVSELADVIDVYYFYDVVDENDLTGAVKLDRADVTGGVKLGTLSEVLNNNLNGATNPNSFSNKIAGSLKAGDATTLTLAFKMQEDAGNEYQNLSIGADFSIQILATQMTAEDDSFDNMYDEDADFAPQEIPQATVYVFGPDKLEGITIAGMNGATLDTGYSFQPTETYEQASESEYEWAHADFFVYTDKDVPANSMALAGYYKAFDGFTWGGDECTATSWIGLTADTVFPAGEANGIRLLGDAMGMPGVAYSEICNYGNDGTGFLCGAADLTGANEGTTLYVELRIYKVGACGITDESHHHNDAACETGEYITIGKFQHTFDDPDLDMLADGSVVSYGDNGEVVLVNIEQATVTNGEYCVPDGVTALGGGVFAQNADIKTVVISDTVTDFGATGVSATGASGGAFKGSAVETVELPDGMTEIPAAAFNGAKKLTSVNIPASVETIGVNAFRQTAITELTVPATVENVSAGAFRDMTALTTVKVEGNVAFENYAFRSVPNLTNIYLLGDDVTINGGQFACHSDNGDATGITIYVKNATVAARVYAAQSSAYSYEVKVLGAAADGSDAQEVVKATNDTQLDDAIKAGTTTVVLGSGNYIIPDSAQGKTLTIVGNGETVVATQDDGSYEGCDYSLDGATVTFEGVTINTDSTTYTGYARCKGTYNNCTINGTFTLYDDSTFNGCTFNVSGDVYNIWTWGAPNATFNDCTFNSDGKAILLYGGSNTKLTLNGCTFNDKGGLTDLKAAVEIGDDYGTKFDLIVNDTVVNGYEINDKGINTGTTLWGNKNSMPKERLNVVVDGVDVY